jgi:drug/metabolite transporter (DMT)-like permease
MKTDENQRQAAGLKASISNYVGTATLAVLAGGVGLFTYVQKNFNASDPFYILTACAGLLLIVSFIAGGKGQNTTAEQLADDNWTKDTVTHAFNVQACLTLAAAVLLVIATVVGTNSHRPTTKDPCVTLLSHQLAKPNPNIVQLRKELALCEAVRS